MAGDGSADEEGHILAGGERGGNHGAELVAVGDDALDVEFVDNVVDLLAAADDPDLGLIGMRVLQQFVELCRHGFGLVLGMVKGLEAMAYPTTFMNKVCDRLR